MKFTIITATYNSSSTLKDTLVSVNSQTYPDIEHIIVDGVSKDNSLEIVKMYVKSCWQYLCFAMLCFQAVEAKYG